MTSGGGGHVRECFPDKLGNEGCKGYKGGNEV
jgi:hypothetical protein